MRSKGFSWMVVAGLKRAFEKRVPDSNARKSIAMRDARVANRKGGFTTSAELSGSKSPARLSFSAES
jgi:hypothetical protein